MSSVMLSFHCIQRIIVALKVYLTSPKLIAFLQVALYKFAFTIARMD